MRIIFRSKPIALSVKIAGNVMHVALYIGIGVGRLDPITVDFPTMLSMKHGAMRGAMVMVKARLAQPVGVSSLHCWHGNRSRFPG